MYPHCGGLDIVRVGGVETDAYYLYDANTGGLVGERVYGNARVSCQGVMTSVFLPTAFASAVPDCPTGSISMLAACSNLKCTDAAFDEDARD